MRKVIVKFICFATVLLTFCFQGCSSFKEVTSTISQQTEILGFYSNDCDSIDNNYAAKRQLWQTIDKNYCDEKTGLVVKIQVTKNNRIFSQLIYCDSVICEKIVKGHFKDDQCYYKRRFFYVVPILPVLWWFVNRQSRLYRNQNYLILEEKTDDGGAFIIMAGGNTTNTKRFYKRVR